MTKPLTLTEAAEFLRLSPTYVRKLVQRRLISYQRPNGGRIYFNLSDLEAFLARGRVQSLYDEHYQAERIYNDLQ